MLVRPAKRRGVVVGGVAAALALAVAVLLLVRVSREPLGFESFMAGFLAAVLLGIAAVFGYWTYSCWSLSYYLDRNCLSVRWGGNMLDIPLTSITALIPGDSAGQPVGLSGIRWPGFFIGRGAVPGFEELDDVHLFSTHQTYQDLLYVLTPVRVYGISVPDQTEFARELGLHRRIGPTEAVREGVERWVFWDAPIWQDWKALAPMLLAVAMNMTLFGYLTWTLADSPEVRALHLDPLGMVDQSGPKDQLLTLPKIGLLSLVVNSILGFILYERERFATYLVGAVSVVVQLVLWGGVAYLLANG